MSPVAYVDLRCLQDYDDRVRGTGRHLAALLTTRAQSAMAKWKLVGLIDPLSPNLRPEYESLIDEVTGSLNPCCNGRPAVFIDGAPMTHDTRFSLRFAGNPAFLTAAVIYDFIPLDWPGYLPGVGHRIDYVAKMARLRKFDLFFPISEYAAWRLAATLAISKSRITVTGASVRRTIFDLSERLPSFSRAVESIEPYFLAVVGPDRRKNPEVAVTAVRHLNLLYSKRISLKMVGRIDPPGKEQLLQIAGHAEGAGFLEFCPDVSAQHLVSLYAGAMATIVPSHIEGFSLPIVEAAVCRSPVIASTCAAHLELIEQPEALFQSDDAAALAEKLEAFLNTPALRDSVVVSQMHLGARFHEDAVGRRFWNALSAAAERRYEVAAPHPLRGIKPRLAFLSPFPPDQSGVARYTAMALQAGAKLFDADLYTDAPRPLTSAGTFRDCGGVTVAPIIAGGYNGIISVLGNSHFHSRIFDIFERFGGPCILHDARLVQIYAVRLGHERFMQLASTLLGRQVSMDEVHSWLQDRNLALLFLEPVIQRASPLMVHTVTQQAEIKRRYGTDAEVITSCPTVFFRDEELTMLAKQAARERQGVVPGGFLISSFGYPGWGKGIDTIIFAVEILRNWNIPAELYFVGNAGGLKGELNRLSAAYGIAQHVHVDDQFVDDATYRDLLIASDAAVQLRTYAFGQLSAALTDSISAGLCAVASDDLAESCDAPGYVSRVPDRFSPLQVAEQLALIWEAQTAREKPEHKEARFAYLQTHNFEYYGKRLMEILGFA